MRLTSLAFLLVLVAACKKTPPVDPGPDIRPPVEAAPAAPQADAPAYVKELVANFQKVYFDFDSATLGGDSKPALDANARIMSEHPDLKIEVQGHADERGTTDYNLALGQKRADSVVKYLQAVGVSSARVKTVSYGEERPVNASATETAWAQNRRAEFVVTWGDSGAVQGTAGG